MTAKIVKWGNGQGLRIPKSVMREMKISLGDNLERSIDIQARHYVTIGEIPITQIQNISDAVQDIFSCYPF